MNTVKPVALSGNTDLTNTSIDTTIDAATEWSPMSQQQGFFARIGSWFKNGSSSSTAADDTLPLQAHADANGENGIVEHDDAAGSSIQPVDATRSTFLRPWAKRDAAITNLQEGFNALTGLMTSVKDTLDRQNQRQDEMMQILSSLPEVLKSNSESSAAQTETLRAITEQIRHQSTQQARVGEVLEKLSETGGDSREMLEALRERVETINEHDKNIADSLGSVGQAMQTVSRTSHSSAQVLEQMRDNINSREGELQRLLQKQSSRYTTMLAIAIFLSIAALAAVCVFGYLLITKGH